ncbi:MAG TPA: mechanosensitive ion channel domain-containing protein [Gemmataceae bacterium]|jgi:small conductance mechanosensitive channel|nr:mechanosensitive ion channel domain-containing protein [Gemmataceae bacterium]
MNDGWHAFLLKAPDYTGRILGVILILGVGWLAVRLLLGPLRRLLERGRIDPTIASFLANSLRTAVVVVILVAVLQQLGVETTSILALLGAVGLAIALSLQGSLANFAAGLIVVAFRMVRVGDIIELGDVHGQVKELLPFHVVLITPDNQRITLPNTLLTTSAVRNHSALPIHRAQWTLSLKAGDDLAAIKETIVAQLRADSRILSDPPPELYLKEWSDDKRVLLVSAWTHTADYQAVQESLLERLAMSVEQMRRSTTTGNGSRST